MPSIPGAGFTREYAFATLPPAGRTTFVRVPVKVLLLANVIDLGTVRPGTTFPKPMTAEEIELYRRDFREVQLFYWCNSSMKYWLDAHVYVDETMYRTGAPRKDADERYRRLPAANAERIFAKLIEKAGRFEFDAFQFGDDWGDQTGVEIGPEAWRRLAVLAS